jgi:DNA-binding transcriptional MerR regulator
MQDTTPSLTQANSTTQKPDLDWSQVIETVRMLNLAVAQIEMSMKEGEDSVGTLTQVFTDTAGRVTNIEQLMAEIESEQASTVLAHCAEMSQQMQYAVLAFQFYDKLTQRLHHVSQSLNDLGGLVADGSRLYNPNEWLALQQAIQSKYTMPVEHEMFEKIMQGASVEEVLAQAPEHKHEDDIELF